MKRIFISLSIFLACYSIGVWISGSFISGWFSATVAFTIDRAIIDFNSKK